MKNLLYLIAAKKSLATSIFPGQRSSVIVEPNDMIHSDSRIVTVVFWVEGYYLTSTTFCSAKGEFLSHRIHVWYIYLHLP